jgi:tryptophan-rich sensory protein
MVFVNYLSNALPINGLNTGQVSANFDNLFTPAGFAFSIWGVIYLLLLVFSLQTIFLKKNIFSKQVVVAFIASCILNSLWIFAWHYQQFALSVVIMLGLLASLVVVNKGIISSNSPLARISFGIYLGWICVATIANVTILLVSLNWGGWGIAPYVWATLMIAAGTIIGIVAKFRLSNSFIAFPIAWAFFAIYTRRVEDFPVIAIAALVGIVALLVSVVYFLRRFKSLAPNISTDY